MATALMVFTVQKSDVSRDTVAVNEIVQTVTMNFDSATAARRRFRGEFMTDIFTKQGD